MLLLINLINAVVDHSTTMSGIIQKMNDALMLSENDVKSKIAAAKRLETIAEAIGWPAGKSQDARLSTSIFDNGVYVVRLSKPGKEAEPDYQRCRYKNGNYGNNPNDMRPEIVFEGKLIEKNASFTDIFEEIQKIHLVDPDGVKLLACLLGRSAYLADHKQISPGVWRYQPPFVVVDRLKRLIPKAYDVPIEVFLYYLDALALNEDVKYHTLGYEIAQGTGRKNNLLTCVNLIAMLLGEVSIAKFAGNFTRPPVGINAISLVKMREIFPELSSTSF
jgi:hypothetical protein